MTTDELLAIKLQLNEETMESSQALTDYCKPFQGNMGLISEECRQSDEYKILKQNYNAKFQSLGDFNRATSKNKELQKAIRDEINQRRINNLTTKESKL